MHSNFSCNIGIWELEDILDKISVKIVIGKEEYSNLKVEVEFKIKGIIEGIAVLTLV